MTAPKPIHFRQGMGCGGAFLSIFPAFGLLLAFGAVRNDAWLPFLLVASICLPALLVLLCGRKGVTLDAANGRLVRWWGFWLPGLGNLPIVRKSKPVEGAGEVLLQSRWVTTEKTNYRVFRLSLGPDPRHEPLGDFLTFLRARARAERVAKALGLPLRDATPGSGPTKREPAALDLALRERLRRDSPLPARPTPPEPAVLRCENLEHEILFEAPKDIAKAMRRMRIVLTALGIAAAILLAELAFETEISNVLGWIVAVAVAVLGLIGLGTIAGATERDRLRVSASGVRRETRSWVSRSTQEIAAERIEEVAVGTTRKGKHETVVAAWGDRDLVEFGAGLPEPDLEWIRREILYRLARD